ncbi:MAG: methyltransferase domain-containing protein [Cellvibrionaceae bacterium]|nr:methyltransferase domain-containing protein [Cellvibrionaceae bacterium]
MKSPHVRSIHGIRILKSKHQIIKRLRKEEPAPKLYGDQVWHSSFLIMEYLAQHPLPQRQRIMDIGCGWGLLGIFCAKHFAGDIVSVDADSGVFPYVRTHETLNDVSVRTEQATFGELKHADFAAQDVIVGADICFWPSMVKELKALIARALLAGVKKNYSGRPRPYHLFAARRALQRKLLQPPGTLAVTGANHFQRHAADHRQSSGRLGRRCHSSPLTP